MTLQHLYGTYLIVGMLHGTRHIACFWQPWVHRASTAELQQTCLSYTLRRVVLHLPARQTEEVWTELRDGNQAAVTRASYRWPA